MVRRGKKGGCAMVIPFIDLPSTGDPVLLRLLSLARAHLDMEVAWLSIFRDGQQVIVAAEGALDEMNVVVGSGSDLGDAFCAQVLAGRLAQVVTDARRHPIARELGATQQLNIGSYVGAPWREADGSIGGMLCCLSRTPDPGLDEHSARYLGMLADLISDHLGSPAARELRWARHAEREIRAVLDARAVRTVFQPVVRLADSTILAYEALSRFDHPLSARPDRAFAMAAGRGLGPELELMAAGCALAHLALAPPGGWLGINFSADTVMNPAALALLMRHAGRQPILLEITEHTPVSDYERLTACLRPLRAAGVLIGVDDAGAGFASLSHILHLRPDVIKLDIALVRGIDQDPVRRALARSLVTFSHEIGATLVAEGVESTAERAALSALGVTYGQGFLWGKPGPRQVWPHRVAEAVDA
jgi:EAL domain-containing protein (putative c-di-GMP-specific phosphodiesterase class I)